MAARSSKTYAEGNTTLRGGEMNVTMTTINGSDRGRINAQLPPKMVSKTQQIFLLWLAHEYVFYQVE